MESANIEARKDKHINKIVIFLFVDGFLNQIDIIVINFKKKWEYKEYLLSIGANSVYTYCLYDTRDNKIVDYYSSKLDKIPLYWPWGYEIN